MLSISSFSDSAPVSSEAKISTSRFETPFSTNDRFNPIPVELSSSLDLIGLKQQAEASAVRKADGILKKCRIPNNCLSPELRAKLIAEQVWEFLMLKHYRRGRAEYAEVNKAHFLSQIEASVLKNAPIELLLSFFPMKTLNPLNTWGEDGSEIDLGEVAALLRLHEIAFGISQFYQAGGKFIVAADGCKYNDCFGYTDEAAEGYFSNIQAAITYLGIQDTIHVFPESSLFPDDIQEQTERHMALIRERISGMGSNLRKHIEAIAQSAAFAIPIPKDIAIEIVALAFSNNSDEDLQLSNKKALQLRKHVRQEAFESAVKYVARYDATREVAPIESHCPSALRATVHAKPGQIGIHPLNQRTELFPHRGQGFTRNPNKLDDARIRFKADLQRCRGGITGIILDPKKFPFSNGRHPFLVQEHN